MKRTGTVHRIPGGSTGWLNALLILEALGVVAVVAIMLIFARSGTFPALGLFSREPSLTLAPDEGAPGMLIEVAGSRWEPGDTVTLHVVNATGTNALATSVVTATVKGDGTFAATLPFEANAPWADLTAVSIWAVSEGTNKIATRPFRILSAPPTGTPGVPATPTPATTSTPEPTQTPEPTPTSTPTAGCSDAATFVKDVTIRDNTNVAPGQTFVKTWQLRNSGTCEWTTDYALVFVSGDRLAAPVAVPLTQPVAPGETVDLSVTLKAPAGNGTYAGRWQLQNGEEERFGTGRQANGTLWVRIVVGPTPTPTPTRTPVATTSWRGEYFGNRDLSGSPALTRNDAAIDFDWGTQSPGTGVPADGFSVRWTRTLDFAAGTYRFYVGSDDGVRLYVDGQLLIDQWHEAGAVIYAADRQLSAGAHTLRLEYYENRGNAAVQLWWDRPGTFPQWRADYFGNRTLSGNPALTRNDANIDFNWDKSAPAAGLPADGFSVRWTRTLAFEGGLYRFRAVVDDGARIYVDGALVIDAWKDGARREVTGDVTLAKGNHTVVVEYYEATGDAFAQVRWERGTTFPDWKGEYWSNKSLSGNSVLVRNDAQIDFRWGEGRPDAVLPADNFSARWTRSFNFDAASYRFHLIVDDGARVWVDDRLIIDEWKEGPKRERDVEVALTGGSHTVRVEYFEVGGESRIAMWWTKVETSFPDWKGEYWSNKSLDGAPALVRNDAKIDFNWGKSAPAMGLPADNFSARWRRTLNLTSGLYRFSTRADDGVRVSVDGKTIINEWHAGDATHTYRADVTLDSGNHTVIVEYYEGTLDAQVKFWYERVGDAPTPQPNRAPVATNDRATTDENQPVVVNVLSNDSDPDGDGLTVTDYDATSARGGTVRCTNAGTCTYTPPTGFSGNDTFGYTVGDGRGGSDTGTVTVKVQEVTPANHPPVAGDDVATTDEDVAVEIDVLANDSDPDGDALTVSAYDPDSTAGGTVSCTPEGLCTYVPPADFNGTDSFAYTLSDGRGGSDTGMVNLLIVAVDDAPIAASDVVTTTQDTALEFNVLINDEEVDGQTLALETLATATGEGGDVLCTSDGSCTYTPLAGFTGEDTFDYIVSDPGKRSATGRVTVRVLVAPGALVRIAR